MNGGSFNGDGLRFLAQLNEDFQKILSHSDLR